MNTDQPTLAVCPFCGSDAEMMLNQTGGYKIAYVRCIGCRAQTDSVVRIAGDQPAESAAIAAWNTRTNSEPRPAGDLREALEKAFKEGLQYAADEGWACLPDALEQSVIAGNVVERLIATHSPAPMAGEAIRAITAEMRRFMPNACGDWADKIDAALAGPAQPLTIAESAELAGYIHGKDYRDNSVEAVAHRQARFAELNKRYLAAHPSTQEGSK